MDPLEIKVIEENLSQLIRNTICHVDFLAKFSSRKVLDEYDIQTITAISEKESIKRAHEFYKILITRGNASKVLLEALETTKQSGALKLLQDSLGNEKKKLAKFSKVPKYFTQFMTNQNQTILIVRNSSDCALVCQRFSETVPNCEVQSSESFLPTLDKGGLRVVNCETKWETVLSFSFGTANKLILVTSENVTKEKLQSVTAAITKRNNNDLQENNIVALENDHFDWTDLTLDFQMRITNKMCKLWGLDTVECICALEKCDKKTLIELVKEQRVPSLFRDTIPDPEPLKLKYYIEREFVGRNVITKKIFEDGFGQHIFLFHGIERHMLSIMTKGKGTETSTDMLNSPNIKWKSNYFVMLEQDYHFGQICDKFRDHSVHLIDYEKEDGLLKWIKSRGSVVRIQQALDNNRQPTFKENDFVEKVIADNQDGDPIFIISDTPGMGKSVLLAQMAGKLTAHLKDKGQKGLVGFLVISELLEEIKKQPNFKTDMITATQTALVHELCENQLGALYLTKNKSYLKDILLDGFDEIHEADINLGHQCLQLINSKCFKESRLWITTRPHMLTELEIFMQVLGYNIQPFTETDQINFFKSYWSKDKSTDLDDDMLEFYGEECVKQLRATLSPSEQEITGIPLQCLLIAEVFESEAHQFSKRGRKKDDKKIVISPSLKIESMLELYEELIKKKFSIFCQRYDHDHHRNDSESSSSSSRISELTKVHVELSIWVLFPLFKNQFNLNPTHCFTTEELLNIGIVESKSIFPFARFIHRTFAEYFVAYFVVEECLVSGGNFSETLYQFVWRNVLENRDVECKLQQWHLRVSSKEFKHSVICYFINALLGKKEANKKTIQISQNFYLEAPLKSQQIIEASVYNDCQNIFTKLMTDYVHLSELKNMNLGLFAEKVLVVAVLRAASPTIEQALHIFKSCSKVPCSQICQEGFTLLHLAVGRGDYKTTVELLLTMDSEIYESFTSGSDTFDDILFVCLDQSCTQDSKAIRDKQGIINYLAPIREQLFTVSLDYAELPIYCDGIHVDLARELYCCAAGGRLYRNKINLPRLLSNLRANWNLNSLRELVHTVMPPDMLQIKDKKITSYRENAPEIQQILEQTKSEINQVYNLHKEQGKGTYELQTVSTSYLYFTISNVGLNRLKKILKTPPANYFELVPNLLITSKGDQTYEGILEFDEMTNEKKLCPNRCLQIAEILWLFARDVYTFLSFHDPQISPLLLLDINIFENEELPIFDLFETVGELNLLFSLLLRMKWLHARHLNGSTTEESERAIKLHQAPKIELRDIDGNTLLHYATKKWDHSIIQQLIIHGFVDINSTNNSNQTPLHMLMNMGNFPLDIWKYFVDNHANVLALDKEGYTPICWFLLMNNSYFEEAVLHVLNHKLKKDRHSSQDSTIIKQIILLIFRRFALPQVKLICEWYAVNFPNECVEKIRAILVGQANIPATILEAALLNGDGEVLEYVLNLVQPTKLFFSDLVAKSSCIPNCILNKYVVTANKIKFIELVLARHPELANMPEERDLHPLSTMNIDPELIKPLVNLGSRVNAKDSKVNTPLHWAFIYVNFLPDIELVRQLIECGADVNCENSSNETPLLHAATVPALSEPDRLDCLKLLIENGADAKKTYGSSGNTIMHILVEKCYHSGTHLHETVKFFVEMGRQDLFQVPNKIGQTPLQIARQYFEIESSTEQLLQQVEMFKKDE